MILGKTPIETTPEDIPLFSTAAQGILYQVLAFSLEEISPSPETFPIRGRICFFKERPGPRRHPSGWHRQGRKRPNFEEREEERAHPSSLSVTVLTFTALTIATLKGWRPS